MKFRHEYKHYISALDYITLRKKLQTIMTTDYNSNQDGMYHIRSLYFDNFRDTALREKIDGLNHREKFRIRCYNLNFDFLNLEKKSKVNGLCGKLKAPITSQETQMLLDGNISWMAQSQYPLIVELYGKMQSGLLRPKTIVDYQREAYVYGPGNVRVTIDKSIKTGLKSTDLFNPALPTISAGDAKYLLEVKYDEFLPDVIAKIVQLQARQKSPYSKYAVCRLYG